MSFCRVASVEDLWSGEMMGLEVEGNAILLINVDDNVYAYVDVCPHQKSRLSEGGLMGKTLRCARHQWEFDVCTGEGINPRNARLRAVPVAVEDRDIFVDLGDEMSNEGAEANENQR